MSTEQKLTQSGISLLLSDARGVHIPRDFIAAYDPAQWGLKLGNFEKRQLSNPEKEFYWSTWETILIRAKHTDAHGNVYRLHHDGDLFVICDALMTAEEYSNFYGEEREQD
jgi:hypothetical protein